MCNVAPDLTRMTKDKEAGTKTIKRHSLILVQR